MNKYDANNPERIRYWIKENIHMIWREIKTLQTIQDKSMVLRITFYPQSFPIVMQWHKLSSSELKIGTAEEINNYISEEMWYINPNFSSINAFADWVNNLKY